MKSFLFFLQTESEITCTEGAFEYYEGVLFEGGARMRVRKSAHVIKGSNTRL